MHAIYYIKIARLHVRNNKRAKTILIAYLISLKTFEYQVKVFSATDVIRNAHEFSQIALVVADRTGFREIQLKIAS